MTGRAFLLASLLTTGAAVQAAGAGSELSGTWNRGVGNARVQIAPCGSQICASNVWVKAPSRSATSS